MGRVTQNNSLHELKLQFALCMEWSGNEKVKGSSGLVAPCSVLASLGLVPARGHMDIKKPYRNAGASLFYVCLHAPTPHCPVDWTPVSTTQGLSCSPQHTLYLSPVALLNLRCEDCVCLPHVSLFLRLIHWCSISTHIGITAGANP